MSLCTQGFTEKISGGKVTIQVEDSDPLIIFGQFDRLDLSDGVDKARFEADRKGMLVARKETPSKNPLSSPDASKCSSNGQTERQNV